MKLFKGKRVGPGCENKEPARTGHEMLQGSFVEKEARLVEDEDNCHTSSAALLNL